MDGNGNITQSTLDLIKAARQNPDAELTKSWTQSGSATSGITAYDLEGPAKKLYPVITPLRNSIPRVSGKGGIQANWRGITGINTNNMSIGVGEGNRSGVTSTSTKDYTAAYKTLGVEDFASFEADFAAEYFDDVKALAVEGNLRNLMIGEEKVILGGNSSIALGTTPTPTLTGSTTGGSLSTQTLSVICVALSYEGLLTGSVSAGIRAQVTRTNADGSSDSYGGGSAQKSANATVSITGPTGSCQASVTAVRGACAYAWFWATAGAEVLGAITTINSVLITANAAGTQTAASLPSTDYSTNGLLFNGLMSFCFDSTSGAYFKALATGTPGTGTILTADGKGGVVEIDAALQSFWDNYRLSPDAIWVNSQEQQNISTKVLGGTNIGAQRFVFQADQGAIAGGQMVVSYLNKFSMDGAQNIPIKLHPNMPAGTIMFTTSKLPYPLSNVANVVQIRYRRDYHQIEWPLRSRKYEFGVYADEVLQNYFPPAFGVITNIANG